LITAEYEAGPVILRLTLYNAGPTLAAMQEPTFLILTALAAQPLHGYGIILSVTALSDGEVKLRPGTLYGALDRLADEGLIVVDHEEAVEGRLRRYYRLSDSGAAALAAQAERLRRHATAAEAQLRRRPGLAGGAA
jgi:DNA-binding PadR family transcriptional regulator